MMYHVARMDIAISRLRELFFQAAKGTGGFGLARVAPSHSKKKRSLEGGPPPTAALVRSLKGGPPIVALVYDEQSYGREGSPF